MKASNPYWKDRLTGRMPSHLTEEIDAFETEIALRKQGRIDEKVFAETRLRRGAYGQRYDNGQRRDGKATRKLAYPSGELTKGPVTLWDAPGMQRIKIPFGGLNASQLEVMAELAEEYSDGIAHVTTRQDFQLHFVHIDDTPSVMRRLAAVGITTREACGNSIRNVTACPLTGVCWTQAFDVTPYAKACALFLLGHPDCQDFGRKFKIAFSGCRDKACALVKIHDFGAIAVTREENCTVRRGFEVYVGGGLGTVPYQAKLFDEFVSEQELLPLAQAIARVYTRLGEKKNRNRARLKFLVDKLGIEEFKRLVLAERAVLPHDPAWTEYLKDIDACEETPLRESALLLQIEGAHPEGFSRWYKANVYRQRQPGYVTVTVAMPLGDITAHQLRKLAGVARKYVCETVRTTVEQNIVLRWVSEADLPALYEELRSAGMHQPWAGTIVDIASCPGTDTCKLGIASSRGLSSELRRRLAERIVSMDEAIRDLRIKVSGCFNSCGQHHVSDIGFYGVSRHKNNYTVPHFQVVLGGNWKENGGVYGLAIGAVPSKRVPEAVDRITGRYLAEKLEGESFPAFIQRIGRAESKKMIEDLMEVPTHSEDPSFYTDWGDAREFTTGDLGVGECAGEVVSPVDFRLVACEREVFEAQVHLDRGEIDSAVVRAYESMVDGARALLEWRRAGTLNGAESVISQFRAHFYETKLFYDPFAQGKFAHYFFAAHEKRNEVHTADSARHLIEEAQLFIEACHSCYGRLTAQGAAV